MAQGTIKKSTARAAPPPKAAHSKKQASKVKKSMAGHKAPASKVTKKFTSGMAARTEAMLGERAGHLELIGQGKKAKKDKRSTIRGGTKKFG